MIRRFPRYQLFSRMLFPRYNRFPTVINIRGTNGSGKSTIVMKLLKKFGAEPIVKDGKVRAYKINKKTPIYVLGRYETPTGGCDTIRTQDEVSNGVRELMDKMDGDVIFEGLLISGMHSRWVELAHSRPNSHFIFAVLDTPLKKCIKRVLKRRKEKGNKKPFNPKTLIAKHKAVQSSAIALKKAKLDVRVLPHKKPVKTILKWLGE